MLSLVRSHITVLLLCWVTISFAQVIPADNDTVFLPEVKIKAYNASSLRPLSRGRIEWNMADLSVMPQFLGTADPLHYTQMMPGIQTNNEYDGGLHIYGCDNSHNQVSIEGVPIYNASHLLGLLSVFNASHFKSVAINKIASSATFPHRIGGLVDMSLPDEVADTASGNLSVGLVSSQGTLRLPVGRKNMLVLSGRISYINLLCDYALNSDDGHLNYSFADANVTFLSAPTQSDLLNVSLYLGGDRVGAHEHQFYSDIRLKWSNRQILALWEHKFNPGLSKMRHTVYYTCFRNRFSLESSSLLMALPSSISDIGYRGRWQNRQITAGADVALHRVVPQHATISGSYRSTAIDEKPQVSHAQEYAPYVDVKFDFTPDITFQAGVRGMLFISSPNDYKHFSVDPSFSVSYYNRQFDACITASTRHQYLLQTGFSSIGLPTEFWMVASKTNKPQLTYNASATFGYRLPFAGLRVSAEVYYKRLKNVIEYDGLILDLINENNNIDDVLLSGKGCNYGIDLLLSGGNSVFSGWLSYHIGRARRTFDNEHLQGSFSANHERIHELNMVMSWHVSKHWQVGATAVCASGTPYTPAECFYLVGGQVISQYGERNSRRLKPYFRIDLSAGYKTKLLTRFEHGVNVSIYNLTARKNELFYSWKYSERNGLTYVPKSFLVSILPSISYYVKF